MRSAPSCLFVECHALVWHGTRSAPAGRGRDAPSLGVSARSCMPCLAAFAVLTAPCVCPDRRPTRMSCRRTSAATLACPSPTATARRCASCATPTSLGCPSSHSWTHQARTQAGPQRSWDRWVGGGLCEGELARICLQSTSVLPHPATQQLAATLGAVHRLWAHIAAPGCKQLAPGAASVEPRGRVVQWLSQCYSSWPCFCARSVIDPNMHVYPSVSDAAACVSSMCRVRRSRTTCVRCLACVCP